MHDVDLLRIKERTSKTPSARDVGIISGFLVLVVSVLCHQEHSPWPQRRSSWVSKHLQQLSVLDRDGSSLETQLFFVEESSEGQEWGVGSVMLGSASGAPDLLICDLGLHTIALLQSLQPQ